MLSLERCNFATSLLLACVLLLAQAVFAAEPSQRVDLPQSRIVLSAMQLEAVRRASVEFLRQHPTASLDTYRVSIAVGEQAIYVIFEDDRLPPPMPSYRGSPPGFMATFEVSLSKSDLRILKAHFAR